MNLVFCMAGLYSRFRDAGYTTPKFLLKVGNGTILEEIFKEFPSESFESVTLIANKRDLAFAPDVRAILDRVYGAKGYLEFIGDTDGQATTAKVAIERLKQQQPRSKAVLFHNIDTVIRGRDFAEFKSLLGQFDGVIDTFAASSPAYSFVKTDGAEIREIAEKKVISEHATTGCYGFADFDQYLKYYAKLGDGGERYISEVYDLMLRDGCKLAAVFESDRQSTLILGTPTEYEGYLASQ